MWQDPPSSIEPVIDCSQSIREALILKKVPVIAINTILASLSDSTHKQYTAGLKKWKAFCLTFNRNFFSPNVEDLLHFLEEERLKGSSYPTLNTLRCAISIVSDSKIGEHPIISRFFKGVFRLQPTTPRYTQIWDVSQVLEFLATRYPLEELSLLELSSKLATSLALVSAHRSQTIHSISIQGISSSAAGTWITITKLIKTSRPGSSSPKIFLPNLTSKPELCVSLCLNAYITRTKELRGNIDQLFITTTNPHRAASKDTVSRWIMMALKNSGINTKIFKTHSTRHAASSSALASGINLSTIRSTAGWSEGSRVFQNFYNIPIIPRDQEQFANSILNK